MENSQAAPAQSAVAPWSSVCRPAPWGDEAGGQPSHGEPHRPCCHQPAARRPAPYSQQGCTHTHTGTYNQPVTDTHAETHSPITNRCTHTQPGHTQTRLTCHTLTFTLTIHITQYTLGPLHTHCLCPLTHLTHTYMDTHSHTTVTTRPSHKDAQLTVTHLCMYTHTHPLMHFFTRPGSHPTPWTCTSPQCSHLLPDRSHHCHLPASTY